MMGEESGPRIAAIPPDDKIVLSWAWIEFIQSKRPFNAKMASTHVLQACKCERYISTSEQINPRSCWRNTARVLVTRLKTSLVRAVKFSWAAILAM